MRELVVLLLVTALIVGGILLYQNVLALDSPSPARQADRPAALPATPTPPVVVPAPTPLVVVPAPTPRVEQSPPRAQQIELGEQELTGMLRDGLSHRGYQADDLVVHLEEGRFTATTSQQLGFFQVPVTIVGEASMSEGQLFVRPASVTAAGVPVAQEQVEVLAGTLRDEFAALLADLPIRPVSFQLKPGKLVVEGQPK